MLNKSMLFRRIWPSVLWAVAILILTGVPGNYFPTVVSFWDWLAPDKIVHIFIFGIQAFLLFHAFRVQFLPPKQRSVYVLVIVVLTTLFSLLTEVLQTYVFIGRHGNVYDFIADTVGVLFGFMAYYLLTFKKKKAGNQS